MDHLTNSGKLTAMNRHYSLMDVIVMEVDQCVATVFGQMVAGRSNPSRDKAETALSREEKRHSQGLVRVDHTGEVCAQALYRGQMLLARSDSVRAVLTQACEEEQDHLAWTHERLEELETHRSYLNFFWYAHSFLTGMLAAVCGDRWSLGFVEETEKQVSRHLTNHINDLPRRDVKSREIAKQMREDEERHGYHAKQAGGSELPFLIKKLMALQSKVMTSLAYYV